MPHTSYVATHGYAMQGEPSQIGTAQYIIFCILFALSMAFGIGGADPYISKT